MINKKIEEKWEQIDESTNDSIIEKYCFKKQDNDAFNQLLIEAAYKTGKFTNKQVLMMDEIDVVNKCKNDHIVFMQAIDDAKEFLLTTIL